jgi:hypothetical protein
MAVEVNGVYNIALFEEGNPNFVPLPHLGMFSTYEVARNKAHEINDRTGVTYSQALSVAHSVLMAQRKRV